MGAQWRGWNQDSAVVAASKCKVSEIVMESTGQYWRPVWNVLEEGAFERLVLVNPLHVKGLTGRKIGCSECISAFLDRAFGTDLG